MSTPWNEIIEVAQKAIIATLEEGAQRGKDEQDEPEWEMKDIDYHLNRAFIHLGTEMFSDGKYGDNDLQHPLTRIAMVLVKLKSGQQVNKL